MTQQTQPASSEHLSRWVHNGPTRIHYLDSKPDASSEIPIVFVPGFGEEAMEHLPFLEVVAPRRCLIVDLRGRGKSDVPQSGYTIDHHADDLESVVNAANLKKVHLASFSRGTGYAMRWATRHPDRVASYCIGDYPPAQIVPPAWFQEKTLTSKWRGRPVNERMPVEAIRRLFADAVDMDLGPDLRRLTCPMLVMRGAKEGSMLDETRAERYRDVVADLRVEVFEESAHDLWVPDPTRFARAVTAFADEAEGRARN
jgi:pimeloyl-ACP methyl ester carboxylesterase